MRHARVARGSRHIPGSLQDRVGRSRQTLLTTHYREFDILGARAEHDWLTVISPSAMNMALATLGIPNEGTVKPGEFTTHHPQIISPCPNLFVGYKIGDYWGEGGLGQITNLVFWNY